MNNRQLGAEKLHAIYQKTGAPLHAAYAVAQLRVWYRENQTATRNPTPAVCSWQTIASACLCRWTGRTALPISYAEASWTGLLNVATCQYEPEMLQLLPPECRAALPTLADYDHDFSTTTTANADSVVVEADAMTASTTTNTNTNIGAVRFLRPEYDDRWPAMRDVRYTLGVGDGACANLGSKCTTAYRIACTVGTSAAVRIILPCPVQRSPLPPPLPPRPSTWSGSSTEDDSGSASCSSSSSSLCWAVEPGLFCYRMDQSHVLVGGALTDGGSVVEWISELLNLSVTSHSFRDCLRQAEALLEEGYHRNHHESDRDTPQPLTVVPFLSGERSTGFRSGATGVMLGLTLQTTRAHLLKGCLEGVTLRLHAIVQLILKVTAQHTPSSTDGKDRVRLICSGKALEVNPLWRRMLADCTGLDVVLDKQTQEGTSRGVAILLARVLAEDENRNGTDASVLSSAYVNERIDDSNTFVPQENARIYWDTAALAQESLLDAVSPLYK